LRQHQWYTAAVAWHPNGALLASGSLDETIRIWSRETFTEVARIGHFPDWVRCLAWHPTQPVLACGCKDGQLWLWHTDESRIIGTIPAHETSIVRISWSTDGRYLASASEDRLVKV
jgi:WD40 repeat protein